MSPNNIKEFLDLPLYRFFSNITVLSLKLQENMNYFNVWKYYELDTTLLV